MDALDEVARLVKLRASVIAEARSAAFLDAVFLICHFNRCTNLMRTVNNITPLEVFDQYDRDRAMRDAYRAGAKMTEGLLFKTAKVGAAFFRYPGSRPYEEELNAMKRKYPGFGESSYNTAVSRSIHAMR